MNANLLTAFTTTPRFPDALCRDLVWLYDQAIPDKPGRLPHDAAQARRMCVETCAACPELERCRQWVQALPPTERPEGVVAGLVIDRRRRTRPDA